MTGPASTAAPSDLRFRTVALVWALITGTVSSLAAEAVVIAVALPQYSKPDGYRLGPILLVAFLVALPLLFAVAGGVALRLGRAAVSRRRELVARVLAIILFVVAGLTVLGAVFAITIGLAALVLLVPTGVALLIASTPTSRRP